MSHATLQPAQNPAQRLSAVVTEILQILNLPDLPPPVNRQDMLPTDKDYAPESNAQRAKRALVANWEASFGTDPPGAEPEQAKELAGARQDVRNLIGHTAPDSAPQMEELTKTLKVLADKHGEVTRAVEAREDLRRDMQDKLLALVPAAGEAVPGAKVDELGGLVSTRTDLAGQVTGAASMLALQALQKPIDDLAETKRLLVEAVQQRRERKQAILRAATQVPQPDGATVDALKAERGKVNAFATIPLGTTDLEAAARALKELQDAQVVLENTLAPLRQRRGLLQTQLTEVSNSFESATGKLAAKAKTAPLKAIGDCEKLLANPLEAGKLDKFASALWALRQSIADCVKANYSNNNARSDLFGYVENERSKLAKDAAAVPDLNDSVKDLKKAAGTQSLAVSKLYGNKGGNDLARSTSALETLRGIVDDLRTTAGAEAFALTQEKSRIETEIAKGDPPGVDPGFAKKLKDARDGVQATLTGGLSRGVIDTAATQVTAFQALLAAATADAEAAARVTAAQKRLATSFGPAATAARPAAKKELERALAAADARASLSGDKRDMVGADKLYAALEARLKEVIAEPKDAGTTFAGVTVGTTPVDKTLGDKVFALCGPKVLATLDAAGKKAMCEAVQAQGPAMEALVVTGLGGDPAILAAIVSKSGADGLKDLAVAFSGADADEARTALAGLVESGGLAAHPEALAEMLRHGVDDADPQDKAAKRSANATALKNMAKQFGDKDGPAAMEGLLDGAGLGSSPAPPAPPVIASLLHTGCDGDAAKMRDFANAYAGDGAQAKANRAGLKGLVQAGGIGAHPETFGPLVKAGGSAATKSLGAAFEDPADLARLGSLLNTGGMAGNSGPPLSKDKHPDTLAKVCVDGFGGDGGKMKQYAQAFDGHAAQSKMMLDSWNEYPDAAAANRQPGQAIAKLLGKDKLNGNIGALQSKFATEIDQVGDTTRKKQAVRFAPHFDKKPSDDAWMAQSPAMTNAGIDKVTGSILRRHTPEQFNKNKMGDATLHSQFPPGIDLAALINDALTQLAPNPDTSRKHKLNVGGPPPLLIEIGFLDAQTVNHFTPWSGNVPNGKVASPAPPHPMEAPPFETDDINRILKAIS